MFTQNFINLSAAVHELAKGRNHWVKDTV